MAKPKFRLHIHPRDFGYSGSTVYWTCSALFPTPSTEVLLHSGPCRKPASAIAEAAFLMRQHLGRRKR